MSSEGLITVTSTTCQCTSWRSMKLPCHHILTARSKLGMSLYDEALCDKRWSTAYYKLNQRIFSSEHPEQSVSDVEIVQPPPRRKTMSQVCGMLSPELILFICYQQKYLYYLLFASYYALDY